MFRTPQILGILEINKIKSKLINHEPSILVLYVFTRCHHLITKDHNLFRATYIMSNKKIGNKKE